MTEEQVTKAILSAFIESNWNIISYDFPQSGTGKMLHPNGYNEHKNIGSIIPDIIAVKESTCLFMENKNRVDKNDFFKINLLIWLSASLR